MVKKVNFDIGDRPLKVDNFDLSLNPDLVRIVKALARVAAEEDFADAVKRNRH
jgi:hypothetical protein